MHISFTANNPEMGSNCKNVMDYLDKENFEREKIFEECALNMEDMEEQEFDKQLEKQNLFFTNLVDQEEIFYTSQEATDNIDLNLSSRHTENMSSFFILNISPSKDELQHLDTIADKKISEEFSAKQQAILLQSEIGRKQLDVIKKDLMHQMLRDYGRDVMQKYAENFDRKVYIHPDDLPNRKEEVIINKHVKEQLARLNIDKNNSDYSVKYQELREIKAKELGKSLATRKMTEKDLEWYGKVEEKRTYKPNDRWVIENNKIQKEISKLESKDTVNVKKISELKNQLHKDRTTGEVVRQGMQKGGSQYHLHVVVSRYDNCHNKRFKGSISPQAHHKKSKVANKNADVGFNRDRFFIKCEKQFDQKFFYERPIEKKYENFKKQKFISSNKSYNRMSKSVFDQFTNPIKAEVLKNSGLQEINKLDIRSEVKKELGFSIPLTIPKTPADIAVKIIKSVIQKISEVSKGY